MAPDDGAYLPKRKAASAGIIALAVISCLASVSFLLWGLIIEGPAFYNGQECSMTYSRFQFLPLHVPSHHLNNRYRLLKFTDGRDPRHRHFYPISGSMMEDYQTQNTKKSNQNNGNGRLLEFHDNWCLLPREEIDKNTSNEKWSYVPHPHRGHLVLYVPGHWGSFSQARSLGAHGTRWTGPYNDAKTNQKIFESLRSGKGMHDGTQLLQNIDSDTDDVQLLMDHILKPQYQDGFLMDVFALDFGEEGAALHSSKILNQADFVARAIETLVEGCHLGDSKKSITIVAHSIGAWAVRASLDMNPHLVSNGWVQNVINLASPLQSIPYAVDSGVHYLVQTLNEKDYSASTERNVTMISVSGGLRDELIPPTLSRGQSDSFLANSMLESKATTSSNVKFGMDHRCIVWCYDLLTQIREVIFVLAFTTDRGMKSSERLNIVRRILHQTSHTTFEEEVKGLHERALDAKGYTALVSVQLAAPYYLNYLLKLCILVGLAHSLLLRPLFSRDQRQQYEQQTRTLFTISLEVSTCLLVIPSIVTIISLLRRSEVHFFSWSLKRCYMHECELLLGTAFVLTQLAALVYFIIVYGVGFVIDEVSPKFCSSRGQPLSGKRFGTMLCCCAMQNLRLYLIACVPLAAGVFFFACEKNVKFDSTVALAPTFYVSLTILILGCLLKLICKPNATNLEERRMTFAIILISLVKATHGKLIFAYSMIQGIGNENRRCSNEILLSSIMTLLPVLLTIMVIETHDTMTQNAFLEWKVRAKSNGEAVVGIGLNKTHKFLSVSGTFLVSWYMWNVLVNYAGDDILLPLYSLLIVEMAYWKCRPLSVDAMSVYAAIIDDDLSLKCEFKDKDE